MFHKSSEAAIAQLGERQTEDLKVPGSIPGLGIFIDVCVRRIVKDSSETLRAK